MTDTVILTGATGRTGRCFIELLKKRPPKDMRFIALVRQSSDTKQLLSSGLELEVRTGDLKDAAFLAKAMKDGTVLMHIAGIHDSRLVIQAAVDGGIKRIIAVHTTGIYSKYKSASQEYIETDQIVQELARRGNAKLTLLRPTMIYGGTDDQNMVRFIQMVDKLPFMPAVGGARYPLQPVHREDLAQAYYQVLTRPEATDGKCYDLSGEEPILLRDILLQIGQCLHKKVRFVYIPFQLAYFCAVCLYFVSCKRMDYREKVQRLVEPRAYPHDEAAQDFGYSPRPFSQGIQQEVEDYLKQKQGPAK